MPDTKFITASEYPILVVQRDRNDHLLAVCSGAPIGDVLQQASDYLEAACKFAYESADAPGSSGYAGAYLVELAKGLVDAAIGAVGHMEVAHG